MFRARSGFEAQYGSLRLMVIAEFNEWKVFLRSEDAFIIGTHQFSEAKAKEHAVAVARHYYEERKQQEAPAAEPEWVATAPEEWLVWS